MKKLHPAILLLLLLACCKEEPKPCMDPANMECENYDPCYTAELPSAAFLMEDQAGILRNGERPFVEEDSIFKGTSIRFRSPHDSSIFKHTWYVGSEVLNGYQVQRLFRDVPRPATITIHHVLEYPVDSNCFPMDDGRDSVSQNVYLIEYFHELATFGTFRVANINTTDSFDFKIKMLFEDGEPATYHRGFREYNPVFVNFNNNNDSLVKNYSDRNYSYMAGNTNGFLNDGDGASTPEGYILVNDLTNEVFLEFEQDDQMFIQKGRKLQ